MTPSRLERSGIAPATSISTLMSYMAVITLFAGLFRAQARAQLEMDGILFLGGILPGLSILMLVAIRPVIYGRKLRIGATAFRGGFLLSGGLILLALFLIAREAPEPLHDAMKRATRRLDYSLSSIGLPYAWFFGKGYDRLVVIFCYHMFILSSAIIGGALLSGWLIEGLFRLLGVLLCGQGGRRSRGIPSRPGSPAARKHDVQWP